jgi:hypothetical protein
MGLRRMKGNTERLMIKYLTNQGGPQDYSYYGVPFPSRNG